MLIGNEKESEKIMLKLHYNKELFILMQKFYSLFIFLAYFFFFGNDDIRVILSVCLQTNIFFLRESSWKLLVFCNGFLPLLGCVFHKDYLKNLVSWLEVTPNRSAYFWTQILRLRGKCEVKKIIACLRWRVRILTSDFFRSFNHVWSNKIFAR